MSETRKEALIALRDRVQAEEYSLWPVLKNYDLVKYNQNEIDWIQRANHGSLDAASALHDAVLPDMSWHIFDGVAEVWPRGNMTLENTSRGVCPKGTARAWLLAILAVQIAEASQ